MIDTVDKIRGVLFGHAIGDALGVSLEGWSKSQIRDKYPQGYSSYEQMDHFKRRRWEPGEWTDDTEQMLCILNSILEKKTINVKDIAKRIHHWAEDGGKGIGRTVASLVYSSGFTNDPYRSSKDLWERSRRSLAPNGGIMRTSVLGAWKYWDEREVIENAETVCRITHWDPRCVGSCVAVSYAISVLLKGKEDVERIYQKVLTIMDSYDNRIRPSLELAQGSIPGLGLDGYDSMGYTLKALSAGFWALLQAEDFKEGILTVINEGGDTDTNGAVAGALLGAKLGFSSISEKYVSGLLKKAFLEDKIEKFLSLIASQN